MKTGFYIIIIFLVSCTRTHEQRDIEVSEIDLAILLNADKMLSDHSKWNSDKSRECSLNENLSLFCALMFSSIDVMDKYNHRQAALQEVRFVIDDLFRDRWVLHRLADFNGNPRTSFVDIKLVLSVAIKSVEGKLEQNKRSLSDSREVASLLKIPGFGSRGRNWCCQVIIAPKRKSKPFSLSLQSRC